MIHHLHVTKNAVLTATDSPQQSSETISGGDRVSVPGVGGLIDGVGTDAVEMPSIKKKVTGFIRQFSSSESKPRQQQQHDSDRSRRHPRVRSPPPPLEKCRSGTVLPGGA